MKTIKTIKALAATTVLLAGLFTTSNEAHAAPPNNTKACKVYKVCNREASVYTFKALNAHLLQDLTYYDAQEKSRKVLQRGAYYDVVYVGERPIKAVKVKTTAQLNAMYKRIQSQQKRDKTFRHYKGVYTF